VEGIELGVSRHRGKTVTVKLPEEVRDRDVYVVGKKRTGKSTLLFNMARQDIEQGKGVGVIDPHGDLVEDLLNYIPEGRVQDTIYLNGSDKERPVGLQIFNARDEEEIGLLADDLIVTFKRISEGWGERMESVLRYTVHALLRAEAASFLDIERLLQNPDFRKKVLAQVDYPPVLEYFREQFPRLPKDALQPIFSRMSKFKLSPPLYRILSVRESKLNFYDALQSKKILLVNLSQGRLGEDSAKLLGSLIVSQIQLAVMRRADLPKDKRVPFYLYVDEFQNFTTSAFEKILSEAGKYKLCLILAHQFISQVEEQMRKAILGNVGTIIMFSLTPEDARPLKEELGEFEPKDLANLPAHETLVKPATKAADTFTMQTLPPPPRPEKSFASEIIAHTREHYGVAPEAVPAMEVTAEPIPVPAEPPVPISTFPERAANKETFRSRPPQTAPPPVRVETGVSSRPDMPEARALGRGGGQHKYLQGMVKRLAEDVGYMATIEKPILGGTGSVDVSLQRDDRKLACEISVTTGDEHEFGNIQKCLAAGYDQVILISPERKILNKLRKSVSEELEAEVSAKVLLLTPDEFVEHLNQVEAEQAGKEEMFRGRKVKVQHTPVEEEQRKARRKAVSEVFLQAFRRLKGKDS